VSVIAVVGSPSAGVSSLAAALADRLPDHTVVEASLAPDAVVVVASAVAPLADSDLDLIERAASGTDLVVGAVSKIDAHRGGGGTCRPPTAHCWPAATSATGRCRG